MWAPFIVCITKIALILWRIPKVLLYALEDLLEKYEIEDLAELEIALDQYYHRYDKVETRRVDNNGI